MDAWACTACSPGGIFMFKGIRRLAILLLAFVILLSVNGLLVKALSNEVTGIGVECSQSKISAQEEDTNRIHLWDLEKETEAQGQPQNPECEEGDNIPEELASSTNTEIEGLE